MDDVGNWGILYHNESTPTELEFIEGEKITAEDMMIDIMLPEDVIVSAFVMWEGKTEWEPYTFSDEELALRTVL